MTESLYKITVKAATFEVCEFLLLDNALSISEIDAKIQLFLDRKYVHNKLIHTSWHMLEWKDVSDPKLAKTAAKNNKLFFGKIFDKATITLDQLEINKLTTDNLREFLTIENIGNYKVVKVRDYILQGKATFSMGERCNEVEQLVMAEVTKRFIDNKL